MNPGTVFVIKDFAFPEGNISPKKLAIILNKPINNEDFLFILTTSKQKWKSNSPGCHSSHNYHFIPKDQDNFDKDTWVMFDFIYYSTVKDFENGISNDIIIEMFDLDTSLWKVMKNCILKSEDIPQDYAELINR